MSYAVRPSRTTRTGMNTANRPARSPWLSMDHALLVRARRRSIQFGALVALVAASLAGPRAALAFAAGVAWSLVNLALIGVIVREFVTPPGQPTRTGRVIAALVVKLPLLYGAGAALLVWGRLPAGWMATGFTWPFVVLFLKALGRAFLRLDDPKPPDDTPNRESVER